MNILTKLSPKRNQGIFGKKSHKTNLKIWDGSLLSVNHKYVSKK
jgi:hypothetical protein